MKYLQRDREDTKNKKWGFEAEVRESHIKSGYVTMDRDLKK